MGSQRGVESLVGQGDEDAAHGVGLLASRSFSGPQTLSPALASLSSTEPHFVGQLCACFRHHLTGEVRRMVDFQALVFSQVLPHPLFPRAGLDSRSQLGPPPFFLLLPLS